MVSKSTHDHKVWLEIAESDLSAARVLFEESLYSSAVFHTQQCAEKALKGYIAAHNGQLRKTHDLVELLRCSALYDLELWKLIHQVKLLKPFDVEYRYPDDYVPLESERVEKAIDSAREVLFLVKKLLYVD